MARKMISPGVYARMNSEARMRDGTSAASDALESTARADLVDGQ